MHRLNTALLILGSAFLAYLVWRIGPAELWRELGSLSWGLIPLILSEGVAEYVHVLGWRYCLSGTHRSMPILRLFHIRMAGYAINYLTPTAAIGGEVTKVALLSAHKRGPEAVTGVLIGKLCFAFAHVLFVVIGSVIILWRVQMPRALWAGMFASSALVTSGMVIFLLLQKHGKLGALIRWLVARKVGGRLLHRAAHSISEVDEALKLFYRERSGHLLVAICWHLVGYSIGILQTALFFKLLTQDVSWTAAAGAWFLGMWFDLLTFAVPLNLGTLEGSRILVLKAIGYNPLVGMAYGVSLRLAQLFWACFGLVDYALLVRKTSGRTTVLEPPRPESQGRP